METRETTVTHLDSTAGHTNGSVARRALDGVRSRRILAFLIDFCFVAIWTVIAAVIVFFLGILTFGLGWLLYAILVPAVALIYTGATLSAPSAATWGMRMMGLRMQLKTGERPDFVIGAFHSVLFYLSITILTPFVLLFSLINVEKRCLHDIVLGSVIVRDD